MALNTFSEASDKRAFAALFAETSKSSSLPKEVSMGFVLMPKPFPTEFWVLTENGKNLGRVGANKSAFYPSYGYIGFFEAEDPKTAQALLRAAQEWLKKQGVKEVFGPICFNTWFPYRFGLPHDDENRFSWEPSNPPEYPKYFEQEGFQTAEIYHTEGHDGLEGIVHGTEGSLKKAQDHGFKFRFFDGENLLQKEVPILHRLSMSGFKDNFLFEPVPVELFRELYVPVAKKADLSYALYALNSENQEVGFFFNFIDSGYFVLKTAAVLSECRGKGVSNAMLHLASKKALEKGINKSISALMRKGIQSESYGRRQKNLWSHEYILYRKTL